MKQANRIETLRTKPVRMLPWAASMLVGIAAGVLMRDAQLGPAVLLLAWGRWALGGGVGRAHRRWKAELHDGVGGRLCTLAAKAEGLPELRPLAQETLRELRRVVRTSGPEPGTGEAPGAVLFRAVRHPAEGSPPWVVGYAGPARALPARAQRLLWRAVHELSTNVVRHAEAQAARMGLVFRTREVDLLVSDDGRGLPGGRWEGGRDGPAHRGLGGQGLRGLQEAARAQGGELRVVPRKAGGTHAVLRLPVPPLPKN
ncbi:MAG: sensor histidine kinase [Myxococcota bacterium]